MALINEQARGRYTSANLFSFIILAAFVYGFARAVYNLYLHPLRKFPGPRLAAVSRWYYDYFTVRGEQSSATLALHEKYGDVVRISPNQLSFIDEQAWKDIYMHQQGRKQLRKLPFMEAFDDAPNLIFAFDDAVHARQRRMVSHAFSDRSLREQESMIKSYVDVLMDNLAADARKKVPTDVVQEFNFATFDIIGDLAFGESFHMLETRQPHPFITQLFGGTRIITIVMAVCRALGVMTPAGYMLRHGRDRAKFDSRNFVHEKVGLRIESGELQRPDLLTGILKTKSVSGEMMPRAEIDGVAAVLLAAGSETTATLLSAMTNLLLTNPEWLAKVQAEVRNEFASLEDITFLRVNRLPLLQAVVEESLRVKPPVPAVFPRVTPAQGTVICGQHVPGNAIVGVPFYSAQHSSRNFHQPHEFHPERWLPDAPSEFKQDRKSAHSPFSAGPRNCVGQNLAWAEIRLITARLLYQFDLQLVAPKDWGAQKVFTIWEKSPLMVQMSDRFAKA